MCPVHVLLHLFLIFQSLLFSFIHLEFSHFSVYPSINILIVFLLHRHVYQTPLYVGLSLLSTVQVSDSTLLNSRTILIKFFRILLPILRIVKSFFFSLNLIFSGFVLLLMSSVHFFIYSSLPFHLLGTFHHKIFKYLEFFTCFKTCLLYTSRCV